jgi:hypothetical protein
MCTLSWPAVGILVLNIVPFLANFHKVSIFVELRTNISSASSIITTRFNMHRGLESYYVCVERDVSEGIYTLCSELGCDKVTVAGSFPLYLAQTHFEGKTPAWKYGDVDIFTSLPRSFVKEKLLGLRSRCEVGGLCYGSEAGEYTRRALDLDAEKEGDEASNTNILDALINVSGIETGENHAARLKIKESFKGHMIRSAVPSFTFNITCVDNVDPLSPQTLLASFDIDVCRVALSPPLNLSSVLQRVMIHMSRATRRAIEQKVMSFVPQVVNSTATKRDIVTYRDAVKSAEGFRSCPHVFLHFFEMIHALVARGLKYKKRGFAVSLSGADITSFENVFKELSIERALSEEKALETLAELSVSIGLKKNALLCLEKATIAFTEAVKHGFADYGGDKMVCCPRTDYAIRLVEQELNEDTIRAESIKLRFSSDYKLPAI